MKKADSTYGIPVRETVYTPGVPEGEERENGVESLFKERMAENFPSLGKDLDILNS